MKLHSSHHLDAEKVEDGTVAVGRTHAQMQQAWV